MASKKYNVVVHGLMTKNGVVVPYGTEVTDGIEVDNATQKVEDGFLLSGDDFAAKQKADADAVAAASPDAGDSADDSGKKSKAKDLLS